MMTIRRAEDRGTANFGWLDSRHTFSFGQYYDRDFMGFGPLRVINEDRVEPGRGFDTHGHANMEIISYVLDGALAHKDSIGTGSVIKPGEVQRMTAGSGIRHSEYNASESEPVHFLQIWIMPESDGLAPGYEQKAFDDIDGSGFRLVASRDGREGSVTIHQDAALYVAKPGEGDCVGYAFAEGRIGWLQVARGDITIGDERLQAGDGAAISDLSELKLEAIEGSEVLLFDMAA
ncbi:MAG: pirin family protein [Alphaproteobacteria bacterium]